MIFHAKNLNFPPCCFAKFFEDLNYEVNLVSNITDIDDKIINRSIEEQISEKLMYRARRGAGMLEHAVRQRCPKQLRRTIRPAKFALSLKTIRGDPSFALQNPSVDELGKAEAQSVLRLADRRPPLPPAYESPQN